MVLHRVEADVPCTHDAACARTASPSRRRDGAPRAPRAGRRASPARARCCMQAAHPVAFAGFFAHTGALDDPYARLQPHRPTCSTRSRFGAGRRAERADRAACAPMHARVRGDARRSRRARSRPARPTRPTTPRCCCGSSRAWPTRPLAGLRPLRRARCDDDERERYWQDYRVIGRHFGLADADMPGRPRRLPRLHGRHGRLRRPRASRRGRASWPRDRHAPAGPAARAARCWSSRTS